MLVMQVQVNVYLNIAISNFKLTMICFMILYNSTACTNVNMLTLNYNMSGSHTVGTVRVVLFLLFINI